MIKKANINWSAKQLSKMMEKCSITFDNTVQRKPCWDDDRKSLLIHSMMTNFPIPPMYAAKDENGYSMLDGLQRSTTISEYLNNSFALINVPEVETESGEDIEVTGKTFDQLPEELQDNIKDYSLTIYYFDGITQDEIAELFYRLNNGKSLSAIEISRIKAKSLEVIKAIGNHELFTSALTQKALDKYTNEDLVVKAWMLTNTQNPSFETKVLRPMMETMDITEAQAEALSKAFTRILDTYKVITADVSDEKVNKENAKIGKRVITRTHLLSLVPVALQSVDGRISIEAFAQFVKGFFSGKKSATINESYNAAAGSGSAKADNVKLRITAITNAYKAYFKDYKVENEPKPEPKPEPKQEVKEEPTQDNTQAESEINEATEQVAIANERKTKKAKVDYSDVLPEVETYQESFELSGSLADAFNNTMY
jgi:hypothetical protein